MASCPPHSPPDTGADRLAQSAARWRTIALMLGFTLAASVVIGLLLALSHGATGAAPIARSIAVALVYASLIGLPAWAIMDRVFGRAQATHPARQWVVAIALLFALTLAACAVASLFFSLVGLYEPGTFWSHYVYTVRIALVVGAACTALGTLWSRLHARLDASKVAEARASELAAEARLHALEARVHPHFLFNTLNSVLSLIPADPERAEELLEKLASLLRFSLDAGRRGLIPLGDEMRIVRDYLDIESARLGERLRAELEIAPGLESWLVPPFAVQTLVENSVRHAIATRRSGGAVRVRAQNGGDHLELSVWDDGAGFTRAELRPGHGLDNLEGRLAALFGGRGRLALERAGGGMSVTVAVPG
jgi:sensor histidine kinase YesM